MVPIEQAAQAVSKIGGPPQYVEDNWDRLVETAYKLTEPQVPTEAQAK